MEIPTANSTLLLLDRPPVRAGARCERPVVSRSSPTQGPVVAGGGGAARAATRDSVYRAPALALMAAVSILEGYKWLGIIPADRSPLSTLVFGRAGAAVFAGLIVVAAALLARPGAGPGRATGRRLVLLSAGAVTVATILFVATGASVTTWLLGAADLALATVVLGTLAAAERSRRRADRYGDVGATLATTMANSTTPQ